MTTKLYFEIWKIKFTLLTIVGNERCLVVNPFGTLLPVRLIGDHFRSVPIPEVVVAESRVVQIKHLARAVRVCGHCPPLEPRCISASRRNTETVRVPGTSVTYRRPRISPSGHRLLRRRICRNTRWCTPGRRCSRPEADTPSSYFIPKKPLLERYLPGTTLLETTIIDTFR